jgi:hypothetical protein
MFVFRVVLVWLYLGAFNFTSEPPTFLRSSFLKLSFLCLFRYNVMAPSSLIHHLMAVRSSSSDRCNQNDFSAFLHCPGIEPPLELKLILLSYPDPVLFSYPAEVQTYSMRSKGLLVWNTITQIEYAYVIFVDAIALDAIGELFRDHVEVGG